jgi:hypothetical protein
MTYEQKAEIFARALEAAGGDVAEALRQLYLETRAVSARARARRAEARRLRAEGMSVTKIGLELGMSTAYASSLCRDVPAPPRAQPPPRAPNPLGLAICEEIGKRLDLAPGWAMSPRGRGRVPGRLMLARRAAMVAMRDAGLSFVEIGLLLRRNHATVIQGVKAARASIDARPLAAKVLEALRSQAVVRAAAERAA